MKSEKEIDTLLRQTLSPDMEPEEGLKKELREYLLLAWDNGETASFNSVGSAKGADWRKNMGYKRNIWAAATAAVCVLALSVTAVATVKYLSRDEILDEMKYVGAKEAFETGEVLEANQVQESGDYRFTLYGIATREALAENDMDIFGGESSADEGSTFVVVSIARKDGTPMPSTSSPEYGELEFFVSPLIQGLDPWLYNAASMSGSYGEMERNGILYRIMECDDIALFADRELYLCITDTTFYRKNAYIYNEADGTITPNEDYEGINLLFDLPIDASRADAEKAQKYLERLDARMAGEEESEAGAAAGGPQNQDESEGNILSGRLESGDALIDMIVNAEMEKGMEFVEIEDELMGLSYISQIPLETILTYGVLDEASVKELQIKDGYYSYSYSQPDGSDGWSRSARVKELEEYFPDGKYGLVKVGISASMGGSDGTRVTIDLLNKAQDGTFTGLRYVITEETAAKVLEKD